MSGATFQYENIGGTIHAPSSKSYSQRMILLSAASDYPITLLGISFCEDELAALEMARQCGSNVIIDHERVIIEPHFRCPAAVNVGESATLYRISLGFLAALGCKTEFNGSPGLARRPLRPLISALTEAGVNFHLKDDGFYIMDAKQRKGVNIWMNQDISSQFVSSMIFYNALLGSDLPLVTGDKRVSQSYIEITLDVLDKFGYRVKQEEGSFNFLGRHTSGREFFVEGDFSSALFPAVLGSLCSENGIRITGLEAGSKQADRMALETLASASTGISMESRGEKIEIKSSLSDFESVEIDASLVPDSCPPLTAVGIFSENGVRVLNYERLRTKESDRVSAIREMVIGFGGVLVEEGRFFSVTKGTPRFPPEYYGKDHRMLMSSITAGLAVHGQTRFYNLEVVKKSYPGYLDDLRSLGVTLIPA
ncbi:MAG: hypothetical protein M1593_01215 [Candidatus Thermoplasmatota archaeon]|nr:hypothetical protein [Candidatus Thermoplasmatota archaeon]MCL5667623.1 hypothetical protein [Candidatus Thermoplasmatota archaeon]